jgi:hypothetical protein
MGRTNAASRPPDGRFGHGVTDAADDRDATAALTTSAALTTAAALPYRVGGGSLNC